MPTLIQVLLLAIVQGAAELLPVSSSAHVITAEKWMGLDPSSPEMTFLLVMLHTGTMFAVLLTFWPRWKLLNREFVKLTVIATAVTGVIGFGLKSLIEKVILEQWMGHEHGEIEALFKSSPLIATALFTVGVLIILAGFIDSRRAFYRTRPASGALNPSSSVWIGAIQGLCLPFRGFSRSGATISVGLLLGIRRSLAEDFSFALAVWLTPPVIVLELRRLLKAHALGRLDALDLNQSLLYGGLGMVLSFGAGLIALKLLSATLEKSRWQYFGFYCLFAALVLGLTT